MNSERFPIILAACAGVILLLVFTLSPQKESSTKVSADLKEFVEELNKTLPMQFGTIGAVNSAEVADGALVLNMSVNGSADVDAHYERFYTEHHRMFLFYTMALNGSGNAGSHLMQLLASEGLNMKFVLTTPSGRHFTWTLTTEEMQQYFDSCVEDPVGALYSILNLHVKMADEETGSGQLQSVAANAMGFSAGNGEIKQVSRDGDDIELVCVSPVVDSLNLEEDVDVYEEDLVDEMVSDMVKDSDMRQLLNSFAIAHANFVMVCEGQVNKHRLSVRIPYSILRKYSDF